MINIIAKDGNKEYFETFSTIANALKWIEHYGLTILHIDKDLVVNIDGLLMDATVLCLSDEFGKFEVSTRHGIISAYPCDISVKE